MRATEVVYLTECADKTFEALKSLGRPVTATELSAITGRTRANESVYLCQLYIQGLVTVSKRGREKVYSFREEHHEG